VVMAAYMMAAKNDDGLVEDAPKLAEAREVKFVGLQMTLESREVNFSQSLTITLYASAMLPITVFSL
jgi:hypothetical protein